MRSPKTNHVRSVVNDGGLYPLALYSVNGPTLYKLFNFKQTFAFQKKKKCKGGDTLCDLNATHVRGFKTSRFSQFKIANEPPNLKFTHAQFDVTKRDLFTCLKTTNIKLHV